MLIIFTGAHQYHKTVKTIDKNKKNKNKDEDKMIIKKQTYTYEEKKMSLT